MENIIDWNYRKENIYWVWKQRSNAWYFNLWTLFSKNIAEEIPVLESLWAQWHFEK